MGKLTKDQSGFSLVEGLLTVIAVAIVAGVGYYIYHSQHQTTTKAATTSASTTAKTTTQTSPAPQAVKSYESCLKTSDTTKSSTTFPPTCTTKDDAMFTAVDPTNFTKTGDTITIANPDPSVCSGGDQTVSSTAKLENQTGNYARVFVSPNCGDSFEQIFVKVQTSWTVINTSHQGICFHTDYTSSVFTKYPDLKAIVTGWCQ